MYCSIIHVCNVTCVPAAAGGFLGGVRSRSGRAGGRRGVSADLHLSARMGFTQAQRVPGVADGHADRSAGEEQPKRESVEVWTENDIANIT